MYNGEIYFAVPACVLCVCKWGLHRKEGRTPSPASTNHTDLHLGSVYVSAIESRVFLKNRTVYILLRSLACFSPSLHTADVRVLFNHLLLHIILSCYFFPPPFKYEFCFSNGRYIIVILYVRICTISVVYQVMLYTIFKQNRIEIFFMGIWVMLRPSHAKKLSLYFNP